MTRRELRALTAEASARPLTSRLRSGKMSDTDPDPSSVNEELRAEISRLQQQNSELASGIERATAQVQQLRHEKDSAAEEADRLRREWDDNQVKSELKHLRAMERLRDEHQRALQ